MTAPAMESLLLTPAEAAEELRTSARSVYRLIADGQIKPVDIGTTRTPRIRIARDELVAFIQRRVIR